MDESTATAKAFGTPSEWCDTRCGRCLLEPCCLAAREASERRQRHEREGVDPDAPETVMSDVTEALRRALHLSEEILIEQGKDPLAPVERPPPSDLSEAIRAAGLGIAVAARDLGEQRPWLDGPLFSVSLRVAAKAARLASFVQDGDEAWKNHRMGGHVFATILLLEQLDEQILALEALGPDASDILDARARFWRALEPVRSRVPAAAREHLARLVAEGRAPSPFVVVGGARRAIRVQCEP